MILQEFNEFQISNCEKINGGWFGIDFQKAYETALDVHPDEVSFLNDNYSKEATYVRSRLNIVEPKPVELIPIAIAISDQTLNNYFQGLALNPLPK